MKILLISSVFLFTIASASAALTLTIEDLKTATLVTDSINPVSGWLSIPSDIGHIIEPAPPISINYDGEFDGLDWYFFYTNPLADPFGTLATVILTDIEVFVDVPNPDELTLWDDTGFVELDSIGITVPDPATIGLLGLGALMLRKRN